MTLNKFFLIVLVFVCLATYSTSSKNKMKSKNAPENEEMSIPENRSEVTPTTHAATDAKVEVKADSSKVAAHTAVTHEVAKAEEKKDTHKAEEKTTVTHKAEVKTTETHKAEEKPKETHKVEKEETKTKENCFLRCGPGTMCSAGKGCVYANSCMNACHETEKCRKGKCVAKDGCHNRCADGSKCVENKCETKEGNLKRTSFLEIKSSPATPALKVETSEEAHHPRDGKCTEWKGGRCISHRTESPVVEDECQNECLAETWCFRGKCRRELKIKTDSHVENCKNVCGKTTECDKEDQVCYPKRLNSNESYRAEGPSSYTCDSDSDCGRDKCSRGWCRGRFHRTETESHVETVDECKKRKDCSTVFPHKDKTPRGDAKDWVCHSGKCFWADAMKPGENNA